MAYNNVLTASEVAIAIAVVAGAAASFFIGLTGMLIAAVCLAFYEQHKRKKFNKPA